MAWPLFMVILAGAVGGVAGTIAAGICMSGHCKRTLSLADIDREVANLSSDLVADLSQANYTQALFAAQHILTAHDDLLSAFPSAGKRPRSVEEIGNLVVFRDGQDSTFGDPHDVVAKMAKISGVRFLSEDASAKLGAPPGHLLFVTEDLDQRALVEKLANA